MIDSEESLGEIVVNEEPTIVQESSVATMEESSTVAVVSKDDDVMNQV